MSKIRNLFKRKKTLVTKKQSVRQPKTKTSKQVEKIEKKILTAEGWKRLIADRGKPKRSNSKK